MNNADILKRLNNHEARLTALEKNHETKKESGAVKGDSVIREFAGPKGGILLLIENGEFEAKKSADDILSLLDKKGYVYKKQVVQNTLNRLSDKKGPLVVIEENGKRIYAKRK